VNSQIASEAASIAGSQAGSTGVGLRSPRTPSRRPSKRSKPERASRRPGHAQRRPARRLWGALALRKPLAVRAEGAGGEVEAGGQSPEAGASAGGVEGAEGDRSPTRRPGLDRALM
jgi:hypothetical protein